MLKVAAKYFNLESCVAYRLTGRRDVGSVEYSLLYYLKIETAYVYRFHEDRLQGERILCGKIQSRKDFKVVMKVLGIPKFKNKNGKL